MGVVKGQVVRSMAGKDKGCFYVIIDVKGDYAFVCDGKHRRLDNLKKKKMKHLSVTKTVLRIDQLSTNQKIKKALHSFCA